MSTKLFVGSLSFDTTDESLRSAFSEHGNVLSAVVIKDHATNRSKGFGFVEFENANEANAAIQNVNDKQIDSRIVHVSMAIQRADGSRNNSEPYRGPRDQKRQYQPKRHY